MLSNGELSILNQFSKNMRIQIILQLKSRGFGHIGGCMSIVELLSVLYNGAMNVQPENPSWEERDWLICSKGHAGPAIYAALALKGFFPIDWLPSLNQPGTRLPSHCDMTKTPGIDITTGSLGQGISVAAGIALGMKKDNRPNRVFCIVGDGECQEGQIWEAAAFAVQQNLTRLTLFIDHNKEQLDGNVCDICNLAPLDKKFAAFGWNVLQVDGHNVDEVSQAISSAKLFEEKPTAVILHTIKGKGCSFAEGKLNHHVTVSEKEAEQAIAALMAQ